MFRFWWTQHAHEALEAFGLEAVLPALEALGLAKRCSSS
jgi:hypothetical protein